LETIGAALTGNDREEHIFALGQTLELYDIYQAKAAECDLRMKAVLDRLRAAIAKPAGKLPPARHTAKQPNAPAFDARAALHAMLGVDLTQIHGLGPALALKLVGECGTNLTAWPSAKHFERDQAWVWWSPTPVIGAPSAGNAVSLSSRHTSPLVFDRMRKKLPEPTFQCYASQPRGSG
jgi:hypothetical protein